MSELPEHIRLLEALLFASAKPLSTQELYEHVPEGTDVGGALMQLQSHYKGRGISLVNTDGQWAFRTAKDLADALQTDKEVEKKLSRAAMETLAIIAYHQPITRAEIENIRGVATGKGTLDLLMESDWVRPGRRRQTPGRPLTWVTTPGFLDHFALESVMDLPGMDELKAAGLLDRRPAIEAIPGEDLFSHAGSTEEDLEEDETSEYEEEVYEKLRDKLEKEELEEL